MIENIIAKGLFAYAGGWHPRPCSATPSGLMRTIFAIGKG